MFIEAITLPARHAYLFTKHHTICTTTTDRLLLLSLQTERPDTILGVICGAVHVAEAAITKKNANFKSALERCTYRPIADYISTQ